MANTSGPTGVVLIQTGTPDSPSVRDVRRYLREFLSDPRVLDVPAPVRCLLLNAVILPLRPRRSAEAYGKIWTEEGSPLLVHSAALRDEVQRLLGDDYHVTIGMRYRRPSLRSAIDELADAGCRRVVLFPLFPQYAPASTGSALEAAFDVVGHRPNVPDVTTVNSFYDEPGFVAAMAATARPLMDEFAPDHVLFSYHGLPERQVRGADPSGARCLSSPRCCNRLIDENRFCYRAQCFATTRSLAAALELGAGSFTTAFQSRLAGQKWIGPHTDDALTRLASEGIRRLAVLTPSFTTDCLETLEEIGIRGRRQWESLGGAAMLVVPCLNADRVWAAAVAEMVRAVS